MTSLQEHLERHDVAAPTIAFRRDCPLCRAERVQGQLPSATLVSPGACAAVTAVILATSSIAPGAVVADGQGVAVPAPPSPPPPPVTDVGAGGAGAAPADNGDGDGDGEATLHTPATHGARDGAHQPTPTYAPIDTSADAAPKSDGDTAPSPRGATTPRGAPTMTGGGPAAAPPADADANGAHREPPSNPPASAETPAVAPATTEAPSQNAAAAPGGGQPPAAVQRGAPRPSASNTPATHGAASASPGRTGPSQAEGRHARSSRSHRSAGSALARETAQEGSRHGPSGGRDGSPGTVRRDGRAGAATGGSRSRARARATAAESQPAATYRVQPGDSLWRIAGRQLGADATDLETAQEVSRLWNHNEQRIGTGNPDLIFPGQTLRM